jgi:hypothetical protein
MPGFGSHRAPPSPAGLGEFCTGLNHPGRAGIISGHQVRAVVSAADVRRRPPTSGLDRAASQRNNPADRMNSASLLAVLVDRRTPRGAQEAAQKEDG